MCLGEPGTGKSSALIQVNALPWQTVGAVLIRSTRPDNRHRVVRPNIAAGRECFLLDPSGVESLTDGVQRYRVSLIERAVDWASALELSRQLVRSAREPGVTIDAVSQAFEEYASQLFAGLLFAAACGRQAGVNLTMADLSGWFAQLSGFVDPEVALELPILILSNRGDTDSTYALGGLANVMDGRSNNHDTIQKVRESLGHLLVGAPLALLVEGDRLGGTNAAEIIRTGSLVMIEVSDDHPARAQSYAALSALVEDDLVSAARRHWRAGASGSPFRMLYDESATGTINASIPAWAATGGGDGVAVMLCAQSLEQLERVFGSEGAGLINTFTHRLFLRGHALSGDRIAAMFGQHEVRMVEEGWSRPLIGLPSRHGGVSHQLRHRINADDLVGIPDGCGLLVSRDHLGPVRLTPSFGEPWATRYPQHS